MSLFINNESISLHNGLSPHLLSKETTQSLMLSLLQNELEAINNHPDFKKGLAELRALGMAVPNLVIPVVSRIDGKPTLSVNIEKIGPWNIEVTDPVLNDILESYLQKCFSQPSVTPPPTLKETAKKTVRTHEEIDSLEDVEESDSPTLTDRTRDITDSKPKSKDKRTRKDREKDLKRTCEECERLRRDGIKLNDGRIEELEKENEELREEIGELEEKLKSAPTDKEIKRLENRIAYLERCLEKREKAIRSLQEANRVLKRENRKLRLDNRTLQQRLDKALKDKIQIQKLNTFLEKQARKLLRQLGETSRIVDQLQDELDAAKRHAPPAADREAPEAIPDDDAHGRIEELEAQLKQAYHTLEDLLDDLHDAEESLRHLTDHFEELEISNQDLRKTLDVLRRESTRLQDQLDYAKGPALQEALKAQESALSEQIEELESRLAEVEKSKDAEIAELRARIAVLEETNREQELKITALRASAQSALRERDLLLEALKKMGGLSLTPDPTSKVEALQKQLDAFADKIPSLLAYAEKLKEANKALKAQLTTSRANEAAALEKKDAFERARNELQAELEKSKREKDTEVEELRNRIAQLEKALSETSDRLTRSEQAKSELLVKIEALIAENVAQAERLKGETERADAAESENDALRAKLAEAMRVNEEQRHALEGLRKQVEEMDALKADLASQTGLLKLALEANERLKSKNTELSSQLELAIGTLTRETESFALKEKALTERLAALEEQLTSVSIKRDAQERTLWQLQQELAKYKQSAEQLAEVSESYRAELERNRELAESLDAERRKNQELQKDLDAERERSQNLRALLAKADDALAQAKASFEEQRSELNDKYRNLENELLRLQDLLGKKEREAEDIRGQLRDTPSSGLTDYAQMLEELRSLRAAVSALLGAIEGLTGQTIEPPKGAGGRISVLDEETPINPSPENIRKGLELLNKKFDHLSSEKIKSERLLRREQEKLAALELEKENTPPSISADERREIEAQYQHWKHQLEAQHEDEIARFKVIAEENAQARVQDKIDILQEEVDHLKATLNLKETALAEFEAQREQEIEFEKRLRQQRRAEQLQAKKESQEELPQTVAILTHEANTLRTKIDQQEQAIADLRAQLETQSKERDADREALSTRTKDDEELRALMGAGPSDTLLAAYRRTMNGQKEKREKIEDQLAEREERAKDRSIETIVIPDAYWEERVRRYEQQAKELQAQLDAKEAQIEKLQHEMRAGTGLLELGVRGALAQQDDLEAERAKVAAQQKEIDRLGRELRQLKDIRMQRRPSVPLFLDRATA